MKVQKSQKKFRFNFIDALLILIILAAGAFLCYIFLSNDVDVVSENVTKEIVYEIELNEVPEEFKWKINIGDKVTDTVARYPIGEVVNVVYSDYIYSGVNAEDGGEVLTAVPGYMDVTVTIRAEANIVNNMYSIGGYDIHVGKNVCFRVPNFTGESYCTTLSEAE